MQSVNSSNGTDGTWEDNWLFKKRKLKTENQSIAMLVPSPTEEIKALIGDKNADETSDLSETEDDGDGRTATFTSTLVIEAKNKEVPLPRKVVCVTNEGTSAPDSLKSMQSLTSLDTGSPTVITEAKNSKLLANAGQPASPVAIQKVNLVVSGPEKLGELTVQVDKTSNVEVEFDSMVSPTQVREHKKSIDEQFEKLVMDDNNNASFSSDIFLTPTK